MTISGVSFSFRCRFTAPVLSLAAPLVVASAQTFDLEDTIDGEAVQGAPALGPAYGSGWADLVSGRYKLLGAQDVKRVGRDGQICS